MSKLSELKAAGSREELNQAQEEAKKAGSGGDFPDYLRSEIEVSKWGPKGGQKVGESVYNIFDIIPYMNGEYSYLWGREKGKRVYTLIVWTHPKIGAGEGIVICPKKTFDKKYAHSCPICEDYERQIEGVEYSQEKNSEYQKIRTKLYPKQRCLYNVWVGTTQEDLEKGIQVFDASYFRYESKIQALAVTKSGRAPTPFADWEKGKSISFSIKKTGQNTNDLEGLKFEERIESEDDDGNKKLYVIPDDILEQTLTLDEIVLIHGDKGGGEIDWNENYQTLYEMHYGEKARAARVEKEEAKEISRQRGTRTEIKEEPVKDEPVRSGRGAASSDKGQREESGCPVGTFGKDNGKHDECSECVIFDMCADDNDKNWKEKEQEKPKDESVRSGRFGRNRG